MGMRAITMRCNKKQFKEIKPKLEGKVVFKNLSKFSDRLDFYLINHLGNIGNVTNVTNPIKEKGVYFYEKWNEKIFLESCGIEIEKPKEETFLITKEQLKTIEADGINYVKEWFPKAFEEEKKELVVGKWYKSLEYPKQIVFASDIKDVQNIKGYGFDTRGDWESCDNRFSWRLPINGNYTEATNQEVEEALIKEAGRRGFKEKDLFIKLNDKQYQLEKEIGTFQFLANILFYQGAPIFNNGQWASIIPTMSKSEAEEKLKELGVNVKIV